MTTEIYVVRHGEAEGNLYRRANGMTQSKLTKNGLLQAEAARRRFQAVPLDAAYSSTLLRARHTGELICAGKGFSVMPCSAFCEINLGVWEGLSWGEIMRCWPEEYGHFMNDEDHWYVEGCERCPEAGKRFYDKFMEVAAAHDGKAVAIFAHGAVIRAFLRHVFHVLYPDRDTDVGHSDNTGVTLLRVTDGVPEVVYMYDSSHLGKLSVWNRHAGILRSAAFNTNLWYQPVDGGNLDEYRALLDSFSSELSLPPARIAELTQATIQDPGCAALAMSEETCVGFVQASPAGDPALTALWLKEPFRGMSLGVQLVGWAVDRFRRHGERELFVALNRDNSTALGFFQYYDFLLKGEKNGEITLSLDIALPDGI